MDQIFDEVDSLMDDRLMKRKTDSMGLGFTGGQDDKDFMESQVDPKNIPGGGDDESALAFSEEEDRMLASDDRLWGAGQGAYEQALGAENVTTSDTNLSEGWSDYERPGDRPPMPQQITPPHQSQNPNYELQSIGLYENPDLDKEEYGGYGENTSRPNLIGMERVEGGLDDEGSGASLMDKEYGSYHEPTYPFEMQGDPRGPENAPEAEAQLRYLRSKEGAHMRPYRDEEESLRLLRGK